MIATAPVLPPILLVGGGKMGGAMLAGWRGRGLAPSVVIDPGPHAAALASGEVVVVPSADALPPGFDPAAVVLAIKPQQAADAIGPLAGRFGGAVVLSIMAGKTVAGLRQLLGAGPLVRAMPNTPAAIGHGITVAFAGAEVSAEQKALCHALLQAAGRVDWIDDEAMMDAVTAVSGSGPAYVFLLAELLEQAALAEGLPAGLARNLARQTVSGAGALIAAGEEDAAALRKAVTSPGGTTQAALEVLMGEWPDSMSRAVAAAAARSRALAAG